MALNIIYRLQQFDGLIWFVILLVPLIFVQGRLHFEIQAVLLLITRRADISAAVFAILFFPGVLLHETSHFVMARLLGVNTVGFSLIPRPKQDGRLQLGYVETARTDVVRDAFIGAAPLVAGGVFVAFASIRMLNLGILWDAFQTGDLAQIVDQIIALIQQPDFWLWFYLTLAVSSTMLPSASDRRAWIPFFLIVCFALAIGLIAGAGPWFIATLGPYFIGGFRTISLIFGVSLVIQATILLPFFVARKLISKLTNLKVV